MSTTFSVLADFLPVYPAALASIQGMSRGKVKYPNKGFWLAQTVNAINSLRLWQNH
jgi:hypothetical protein